LFDLGDLLGWNMYKPTIMRSPLALIIWIGCSFAPGDYHWRMCLDSRVGYSFQKNIIGTHAWTWEHEFCIRSRQATAIGESILTWEHGYSICSGQEHAARQSGNVSSAFVRVRSCLAGNVRLVFVWSRIMLRVRVRCLGNISWAFIRARRMLLTNWFRRGVFQRLGYCLIKIISPATFCWLEKNCQDRHKFFLY
jgi:hypothetical protein